MKIDTKTYLNVAITNCINYARNRSEALENVKRYIDNAIAYYMDTHNIHKDSPMAYYLNEVEKPYIEKYAIKLINNMAI